MNTKIGNKIRMFRQRKGLSQETMADRLHISRSAYGRIETGETNSWANHVESLCRELEINLEDLFASDGLVQNNSGNSSAVQNHTQHDTHITINHLSDKVIELYEEKIKWLEAEIRRYQNTDKTDSREK